MCYSFSPFRRFSNSPWHVGTRKTKQNIKVKATGARWGKRANWNAKCQSISWVFLNRQSIPIPSQHMRCQCQVCTVPIRTHRRTGPLLLSKPRGLAQRCLCLFHTTVLYELEQQCLHLFQSNGIMLLLNLLLPHCGVCAQHEIMSFGFMQINCNRMHLMFLHP